MIMKTVLKCICISIALSMLLSGCSTVSVSASLKADEAVNLPMFKNTANECYYLDDFMPIPDSMVVGKSGALHLRYYTYNAAKYKQWKNRKIILSFYSTDDHCWSLFEESYTIR